MNVKQFERLDPGQKNKVQNKASVAVWENWQNERPKDLAKLSEVIDLEDLKVISSNGKLEVDKHLPNDCSPRVAQLLEDFSTDCITKVILW